MIDWRHWHNEPVLTDGLVVLGWLYGVLIGPLRGKLASGEPWPRACAIRFYSGLGLFYLAVASPVAQIGGLYLFSVHVALQMVILYPAAALILSGLPIWIVDPVLEGPAVHPVAAIVLRPVVCGVAFTLATSVWYLPRLFEWALRHPLGHAVEHLTFFVAALLFWWPLLGRSRVFPSLRYGGRLVYLFCVEVALTAIFTYILMAEHPMYPTYQLAPRLIAGLGAEDDQILGGILLSGISSLVLVGALGVNFLRWAKKSDRG